MPYFCEEIRNRVLATPTAACHAVCATSFFSCTSFHYNLLTAAKKPTCQAVTQSCERDRAIVTSSSAASLRGIPQCDGKYKIHRVNSLHQGKQHNSNFFSNAVSHGRWGNAECLNCRQGVRFLQHSCGRLGFFQTRRYEMSKNIFDRKALCSI
ncbi:mucin-associated surface protein (MASP) [Trypanosoma cruzi]|nr:mucin-associated surface protein (MASP) [Trypanosoma cruzi]